MSSRRDFLKGSLVLGVAVAAGRAGQAQAGTAFPTGLVYTKDNPGRWAGKEGLHVPKVAVTGGKVTILTPHPMTPPHFIVKHTLLTPDGKVIGEKTFTAADPKAESACDLPAGFKGKLCATSFCNLHDLWLTELTV
jgi:superoxide reductase